MGDDVTLQAIDAGAADVQEDGRESVVYTEKTDLARVREALTAAGLEVTEAVELVYVPKNTVNIQDSATAGKIIRLMDALDDCDDVTATYVNFDIPEEFMN